MTLAITLIPVLALRTTRRDKDLLLASYDTCGTAGASWEVLEASAAALQTFIRNCSGNSQSIVYDVIANVPIPCNFALTIPGTTTTYKNISSTLWPDGGMGSSAPYYGGVVMMYAIPIFIQAFLDTKMGYSGTVYRSFFVMLNPRTTGGGTFAGESEEPCSSGFSRVLSLLPFNPFGDGRATVLSWISHGYESSLMTLAHEFGHNHYGFGHANALAGIITTRFPLGLPSDSFHTQYGDLSDVMGVSKGCYGSMRQYANGWSKPASDQTLVLLKKKQQGKLRTATPFGICETLKRNFIDHTSMWGNTPFSIYAASAANDTYSTIVYIDPTGDGMNIRSDYRGNILVHRVTNFGRYSQLVAFLSPGQVFMDWLNMVSVRHDTFLPGRYCICHLSTQGNCTL